MSMKLVLDARPSAEILLDRYDRPFFRTFVPSLKPSGLAFESFGQELSPTQPSRVKPRRLFLATYYCFGGERFAAVDDTI